MLLPSDALVRFSLLLLLNDNGNDDDDDDDDYNRE